MERKKMEKLKQKHAEKLWRQDLCAGRRIEYKGKNRGITLIALMITIIVLLILAGVTLNLTLRRKRNI